MKKVRKIFGITICAVAVLLLVSGCGSKQAVAAEEKTLSCTLHRRDVINNYELDSTYVVYYKNNVVNKVKTTEVVSSSDQTIIDYFKETLDSSYSAMDKAYGGYEYTITPEDGKVTSITSIDYTKINMDQLIKDDASIKSIVNSKNQITVNGIKKLYQQMGAECS